NEQLEAEVLTRSSNSSKTSDAVPANLSELELKKILIEKMESNKDTITLKRRQDDEDKDEEPSARSNRGSKRRRAGKEPESTSAPKEKTSKRTGKSTKGSKSHHKESARDVYSKRRIITVTELQIVEWHDYKHLDWITNKDKQNRLMRIDELHKFSDDTLNDDWTALDDRLKGIQMQYLPQTIWRRSDKDRATAMIQAIDK
nr:hypothetical protein [Tanacetum cinerariifolium]